jgi:hypothetical protein
MCLNLQEAGKNIFVNRETSIGFLQKIIIPNCIPTGEDFRKIHRSTIINVNYVSGLARGKNDGLEVILKDSTKRKVSRNYSKEIRTFFKNRSL